MKKEELLSIMKELKEEGKIKDFYKWGFTIEGYKDKWGDDFVIDYGQYVTNHTFHCSSYCEIYEYFNSKTQLKSFIETVLAHNDKYYIYNFVDEFYNKEYCEEYRDKYYARRRIINENYKSKEDSSC